MIGEKDIARIQQQAAMQQAQRENAAMVQALFSLLGRCAIALELLVLTERGAELEAEDAETLERAMRANLQETARANREYEEKQQAAQADGSRQD